MEPLAPPLLSTTMATPVLSIILATMARVTMSRPPPAEVETVILIGLFGKPSGSSGFFCAIALEDRPAASAPSTQVPSKR